MKAVWSRRQTYQRRPRKNELEGTKNQNLQHKEGSKHRTSRSRGEKKQTGKENRESDCSTKLGVEDNSACLCTQRN